MTGRGEGTFTEPDESRGSVALSAPVLNGIPVIYRDEISTGIKSSRGTLGRRESIHRARCSPFVTGNEEL